RYLFGSKRPMVRSYTATPRARVATTPFHSFISTFWGPGERPWSPNGCALSAPKPRRAALNVTGIAQENFYNRKSAHECIVPYRRHRQSSSAPLRHRDLHPRPLSGDLDTETRPR